MGRKMNDRQKAKFPFKGKPIEFYRPTDGQGAAIVLASSSKGDGSKGVIRFFQILEKLTVKPSDWAYMEDKMIDGEADVKDFGDLIEKIFNYDWPDANPADGE